MRLGRRGFIGLSIGAALSMAVWDGRADSPSQFGGAPEMSRPAVGERYPGWNPGELDIHFIQTGVGEQTFFIFPDGAYAKSASRDLYPGERIIMYGHMPDIKREHYADRPFMKDVVSVQGHSVFKVASGGKTFEAFVLTNEDESMRVLYRKSFASGAMRL